MHMCMRAGVVLSSPVEAGGVDAAAVAAAATAGDSVAEDVSVEGVGVVAGEGPTFLENIFGDCLSYPNVVWAQEVCACAFFRACVYASRYLSVY
jgi:hypothetical protein